MSNVTVIPQHHDLRNLRARIHYPAYLRQVWERRWFVIRTPIEDLRTENQATKLGTLWHLLDPLLLLAIFYTLFAVGLRIGGGIEHFTTYLAIGIFFYRYSEQAANRGASCILANLSLINSIRFPRLILPISAVFGSLLFLGVSLVPLTALALIDGARPSFQWLLVVPILVVQTVFNIGLAALLARLTFAVADTRNLVPHVFRMGFYLSGVFFPVQDFFSERWQQAFLANPFFGFISLYRKAILDEPVVAGVVPSVLIWAAVLLVVGVWLFVRSEFDYGQPRT